MLKKYSTKLIAIILILFSACTKEVGYILQESDKIPVIQSIMNPDSIVTVFVAQSTATLESKLDYVSTATVLLYCDDVLVDTLKYNQVEKYYSKIYPAAGKKYKIVTYMPNGQMLWGETTIPTKPINCNPKFTPNVLYFQETQYGKLELKINDSSIKSNYYEIILFKSNTSIPNNIDIRGSKSYIYEIDQVVINEGDWGYNPQTIFFSDDLFNGKIYDFSYTVHGFGDFISINGSDTIVINETITKGYIAFKSISYDFYKYRKSYTRHIFNAGMQSDGVLNLIYIGDPVDMYSNVKGGVGIIASYNQKIEKIKEKL